MPDLICLVLNHNYTDDTPVYVSWLDDIFYVFNRDQNSFKLAVSIGGSLVQFTETVTDGFVREDNQVATATITGLDHLEGETVTVTSGGNKIGEFVVSDGTVTLNSELTTYQAGLPYKTKIRTMRLSIPQEGGTLQSRIKRINETTARHIRTKGGKVGQEYNGVEYLTDMDATFSTDSADSTLTPFGGFTEDAYTTVVSDDPEPLTLLATIVDVEIEERR